MQAIITKYLPATNYRGARIKASAQAGSVTIPWDYARDTADNHHNAAQTLRGKFGWLDYGKLIGGALPDDSGYAFIIIRPGDCK